MAQYDDMWIADTIRNSDFYKPHAYKGNWISGSYTIVHPITIFGESNSREIAIYIQMDRKETKNRYGRFRRLLSELRARYPRMEGMFCKLDGSCPDYYEITVWKKGFEPKKGGRK